MKPDLSKPFEFCEPRFAFGPTLIVSPPHLEHIGTDVFLSINDRKGHNQSIPLSADTCVELGAYLIAAGLRAAALDFWHPVEKMQPDPLDEATGQGRR